MKTLARYVDADTARRIVEEVCADGLRILAECHTLIRRRWAELPPGATREVRLQIVIEETARARAKLSDRGSAAYEALHAASGAMH